MGLAPVSSLNIEVELLEMNSLPQSRFLKILMHLWVLVHMGTGLPCLIFLKFQYPDDLNLKRLMRRILRRLIHRKSSFLELLVLPGFLSDPRQRGFGLTFFDREKNPQRLWRFFLTPYLSIVERLFFVGVLALRWLSCYEDVIRILEKRRKRGGLAGALCSLYLADLCLFAKGWTEEFEIDRSIHSSATAHEMFGEWYGQLLGTNNDLEASFDYYLADTLPLRKHSPYVSYLLLLQAFQRRDWAKALTHLFEYEKQAGRQLPFTRAVLDACLGNPSPPPPGVVIERVTRVDAVASSSIKVLSELPAREIEISFHEIEDGRVSEKRKRIRFPAWSCGQFSKGVVGGSFATDVVLENKVTLEGSLIFNDRDDPRKYIFSRSRACAWGNDEVYVLEKVDKQFKDVILLPSLSDNFFHFMFDTVGAYLLIPESERRDRKVLFGGAGFGTRGFHRDIMARVGMNEVIPFWAVAGQIEVENGIWCQEPSWNTVPRPEVVEKVLMAMRPAGDVRDLESATRAVFFYRTGQRRLPKAYFSQLKAFCGLHQIEMHDPSTLTIAAQIELMSQTRILFVESGAAASNAIYLPDGAVLVVLVTRLAMKDCFITIPYVKKLRFIYVYGENLDFFANTMHIWTEPLPGLDLKSLERAYGLAQEFLAEKKLELQN